MNKPLLELKSVTKSYKGVVALGSVSFGVHEREVVALAGLNGAGKSTLLGLVTQAGQPDEGEILYRGIPVKKCKKEYASRLGFVPQDIALYEELSVEANLKFFAHVSGAASRAVAQNIEYALGITGMQPHVKRRVSELSGGMKHRVNIACGLVGSPELLVLDEPTTGIDAQTRETIYDSVKRMNAAGQTLIIATHDSDAIERLCTRVVYLSKGVVTSDISVADIAAECGDNCVIEAAGDVSSFEFPGSIVTERGARILKLIARSGDREEILKRLNSLKPQSVSWRGMTLADYLKRLEDANDAVC